MSVILERSGIHQRISKLVRPLQDRSPDSRSRRVAIGARYQIDSALLFCDLFVDPAPRNAFEIQNSGTRSSTISTRSSPIHA